MIYIKGFIPNEINMKSQLVIYPAMLALLFTGCDEEKVDATDESNEAQNEASNVPRENDTLTTRSELNEK